MSLYRLTAAALDDINEIVSYLATEAGDTIATRIEDELFATFENLAVSPGIGHSRTDLTSRTVAFFTVDPYLIIYQRDISPIRIHGVLHGARDIKRIFRKRPI